MELKINAEWEEETKGLLRAVIDQISKGLNLESLEYIIIPKEFSCELFAFQKEKGLRAEFTKDELGTAVGKNLSYFEGPDLKQSIVLDSTIAFIDPEKSDNYEITIFLINHELCHVHDNYMKYKTIGWSHKPHENPNENLSILLKNRADDIWSEYIANRLALREMEIDSNLGICSSPLVLNFDISLLLDRIPLAKEKIQKSIFEYRYHANIMQLCDEVIGEASQLLKAAGRVYGHLHGLNLNDTKTFNEKISETYFKKTWESLEPALQDLYEKYPNWSSSNELDDLSEIVLKTWNSFGIYPKDTIQGMYVDVPFQ